MKSKKIRGLVLTGTLNKNGILETNEGNSLTKWYEKLDCKVIEIIAKHIIFTDDNSYYLVMD